MKLLRGKTLPALAEALLREPQWREGEYVYLIVPDRFSLEAETALISHAPGGVSFASEATTFARLVARLVPAGRALSKEGSVMAVAHVMTRLDGELKCLSADRAGHIAGEVYATIAQLMASDLAPEDLDVPADGALKQKLADLRLIYRAYLAFLERGFRDPNAAMFDGIRAIEHAEWVKNSYFFALGFDSLTRANRRFLAELDRHSRGVTAAAVDASFRFGSPTLERELEAYTDDSVAIDEPLSPTQSVYWRALDADAPDPADRAWSANGNAEIFLADSVPDGARFLAERVFAAAREDGLRWRDIAIAAAEPKSLADVLSEYGIPVNFDETTPLGVHPLARLCISILECATSRCSDAAIRRLCFNPLLDIPAGDYAAWDNYTLRFGISHAMHLSSYTAIAKDDADGINHAAAERVRARIAGVLQEFDVPQSATAGVYADVCRRLVERFGVRSDEWHASLALTGEVAYVEFGRQAKEALAALLDNLAVVDEDPVAAEDFLRLLNAGVAAAELRVTPAYSDAVNLFTPDSFGFRRYSKLFWYGADEGTLPARSADCGLITDAEIDALAQLGAAVDPKIEEVNARARYRLFATLFNAPKLTVICHGGASSAHPNCFVRAMNANLGVPMTPIRYATDDEYLSDAARADVYRVAVTPALAAEEFLRLYRRALSSGRTSVSPAAAVLGAVGDASSPERRTFAVPRAQELFFGKNKTSVSQIERYFTCPYMHFVSYGLRCKDRKVAAVRANDVGNFLHAVAERFAPALPKRKEDCAQVSAAIVGELVKEDELFGLDTDAINLMRRRLDREAAALCEKLFDFAANTDFVCEGAEKEFGGEEYPALGVGRAGILLGGRIDRIDRLPDDDRVMIIDYKTGKADFDLKDVYFGRQLQLFAYMRVLSKIGKRPAAALFFPVNNDYGEEKCCGGWIASDPDTVLKLDKALDFDHCVSRFLPVNLNKTSAKKGEWKLTGTDRALGEEEWDAWLRYTEAVASIAADELCEGYIDPRPLVFGVKSPCAFCPARGACDPAPSARVHNERVKDLRPFGEDA